MAEPDTPGLAASIMPGLSPELEPSRTSQEYSSLHQTQHAAPLPPKQFSKKVVVPLIIFAVLTSLFGGPCSVAAWFVPIVGICFELLNRTAVK